MDAILLRSLPVSDPASLVVVKWRSKPVNFGDGDRPSSCMHSIDGSTYRDPAGVTARDLSVPGVRAPAAGVGAGPVQPLRATNRPGDVNVMIKGEAELAEGEYVSGDFFRGLAVSPAAGRLIVADDDRAGAAPVAVLSLGYSQRRFGDAASAIGQPILINNVPFTVVGVDAAGVLRRGSGCRARTSISRCTPVSSSTRMPGARTSTRTTTGSR